MKKWFVVLMIMIIYWSTGVYGRAELREIQITRGKQPKGPSIYGNLVAWEEKRDGRWER